MVYHFEAEAAVEGRIALRRREVVRGRQSPPSTWLRALRATRPHTVGYIGGCDHDAGEIECPCYHFEAEAAVEAWIALRRSEVVRCDQHFNDFCLKAKAMIWP